MCALGAPLISNTVYIITRLILIISLPPDNFWEKGVMQIVVILHHEENCIYNHITVYVLVKIYLQNVHLVVKIDT